MRRASLVAKAKSGLEDAFGELYKRHRVKAYRAALRILRNQQDAGDAVQRAFQRAFTNLKRFRGESTFSTWLTRVAINEAQTLVRQHRPSTRILVDSSDGDCESWAFGFADKAQTPEEMLAEKEFQHVVIEAISQLRKNLRTVVVLRELQGLTNAEAARRLGLSVSTVKARTFRARRYLRQQLKRKYKIGGDVLIRNQR